jgi:N-acetylneuraminate lyase
MKNKLWISGLVPAVFTPMRDNGALNLAIVDQVVDYLIGDGAAGLYVCGSTGEGPSLSAEERCEVAEAYVRAASGRIPVIIQVGHNSLRQARRLAEHAQSIGANAISAVPPSYFKMPSLETLIDCLAEIIAGAPELPFYYYHIPRLTTINVDCVQLLQKGAKRLPTLNGIKYSDFTVFEMQACLNVDNGRYNLLFGSDEMLLSGLVAGAHGAVGSTFNFASPLYNRIISAHERGDIAEAQKLQGRAIEMIRVINRHSTPDNNLPALKATMNLLGLPCGPTRLPLVNPPGETLTSLYEALKDGCFLGTAGATA